MALDCEDPGAVCVCEVPCFMRKRRMSGVFSSLVPSVWSRFTVRTQSTCNAATGSCASDRMISSDAAPFVFIATPVKWPVMASASSCKYLLPSISSWAIGSVVSEETASSGTYLLLDRFLNDCLRVLPRVHASHYMPPSSPPIFPMCEMASARGSVGILFETKPACLSWSD